MVILCELSELLEKHFERKVDKMAILNVLQAITNNIFSFKNITFESCENLNRPYPLAYYGINFVPSGGVKTSLIDTIYFFLFNWFDEKLKQFNDDRFSDMSDNHALILSQFSDKAKEAKRKKMLEFEKEEKNFVTFKKYLTAPTQSKLYEYLDIIRKEKKGSVLIILNEFGTYFYEAKQGKDIAKNQLLNCLNNLHDGKFEAQDSVTTDRENIDGGIPANIIFFSDYSVLKEDKILLKAFKLFLKGGIARRTFIYCNTKKYIYDEIEVIEDAEETEQLINKIKGFSIKLKDLYEKSSGNYKFSIEANKLIKKYKKGIIEELKEKYKFNQNLSIEDDILRIDYENSTWKIVKLAVLYHLLDNPSNDRVQKSDVEEAIKFYSEMRSCLETLLHTKPVTETDELFNYLVKNINKIVSFGKIRDEKFVNNTKFAKWIKDEALPIILDMCKNQGLGFEVITKDKNSKYLCIYDNEHKIENNECIKTDYSDVEVDKL